MTDPGPDRVLGCPKPDRLAQVTGFVRQYLEGQYLEDGPRGTEGGPRADEFWL